MEAEHMGFSAVRVPLVTQGRRMVVVHGAGSEVDGSLRSSYVPLVSWALDCRTLSEAIS